MPFCGWFLSLNICKVQSCCIHTCPFSSEEYSAWLLSRFCFVLFCSKKKKTLHQFIGILIIMNKLQWPFLYTFLSIRFQFSEALTTWSRIAGSSAKSVGNFEQTAKPFSKVALPLHIPPARNKGSDFSTSSPTFAIFYLFENHYPRGCEAAPHCGFDLHSPTTNGIEHLFYVLIGCLYIFFGETSLQVLCPLFNWFICLVFVAL